MLRLLQKLSKKNIKDLITMLKANVGKMLIHHLLNFKKTVSHIMLNFQMMIGDLMLWGCLFINFQIEQLAKEFFLLMTQNNLMKRRIVLKVLMKVTIILIETVLFSKEDFVLNIKKI